MMSSHIKLANLGEAVDVLSKYDVSYKIEKGLIYGKDCYWITFNNSDDVVDAIFSIRCLSEHDD